MDICRLVGVFLLTLVLSFSMPSAEAGTIVVPDDFATIQLAIDSSSPRDTILVRPGVYLENLTISRPIRLIGSGPDITVIRSSTDWGPIRILSDDVEVRGLRIRATGTASYAIFMFGARDCRIEANKIEGRPLWIQASRNISIYDNVVTSGGWGVRLAGSSHCTLRNNTIASSQMGVSVTGYPLENFVHDIDASNTVDGKPIRYLLNKKDLKIDADTFDGIGYLGIVNSTRVSAQSIAMRNLGEGLLLAHSRECTISDVLLVNNNEGLAIHYSTDCLVTGSEIRTNGNGIRLQYSERIRLERNNIVDNRGHGIVCHESSHNTVSENNFVRNKANALSTPGNTWDGNYWSDYTGQDLDHDGIGDVPYLIGPSAVDNHPLMMEDGWRGVVIDISLVSSTRCDINSSQTISFHAAWILNRSSAEGITALIDGTPYLTNSTGWICFSHRSSELGKLTWRVTEVLVDSPVPFRQTVPDPSIVWDLVEITIMPTAERVDVGSEGAKVSATYVYDGARFEGRVVLNDTATKPDVGRYGYRVEGIADSRHGLKGFTANDTSVVFDRIAINLSTHATRIDVGDMADINWVGSYEYDNALFNGSIVLNNPLTSDRVGLVRYQASSIDDPTHGISVARSNEVQIIFDRVRVDVRLNDDRINVGDQVECVIAATHEYDGSPYRGSVYLNDTQKTLSQPGRLAYTTMWISDPIHNLTAFTSNTAICIWDRVRIALSLEKPRIDAGAPAKVSGDATYEYDQTHFVGYFHLNDTLTKRDVGRHACTVSNITDILHGLSIFSANIVEVIFDTVVVDLSILDERVDVGTSPIVLWSARYAYDHAKLKGTIVLNDTMSPCYSPSKRWYATESITDLAYGLKSFQSNAVSCIFDRVNIRLDAPERVGIGTRVKIKPTARYEYDDQPFHGQVILNDTATCLQNPCKRAYTTAEIWDPLYGLTGFSSNTLTVIFDLVQVALMVEDRRIDVHATASIKASAVYAYDGAPFTGSIVLNDTQSSHNGVGQTAYTTKSIVDEQHGLRTFSSNTVSVIFDRVEAVLSSPRDRVEVGSNATIRVTARYGYDGEPFEGLILINQPTLSDSPGHRAYSVDAIIDSLYGLTAFEANQLEIVFDRIDAEQRVLTACPGKMRVRTALRYATDNSPVEDAVVTINGMEAGRLGGGAFEVSAPNWAPTIVAKTTVAKGGFTAIYIVEKTIAVGNLAMIVGLTVFAVVTSAVLIKRLPSGRRP